MEKLTGRIAEVLENELATIYEEQGIKTGDISPEQYFEWERLTAATAALFFELIEQNK